MAVMGTMVCVEVATLVAPILAAEDADFVGRWTEQFAVGGDCASECLLYLAAEDPPFSRQARSISRILQTQSVSSSMDATDG